jgi:hypothetical protein
MGSPFIVILYKHDEGVHIKDYEMCRMCGACGTREMHKTKSGKSEKDNLGNLIVEDVVILN